MTSKRTRSGGRRTRASSASAMLPATSASKPSRARCVTRGSEIAFSSSTSRMRGFTAQMVAAGRGSRFCQSCIGGPRSATNAARDESGSGWPGRGPCPPHVREDAMSASSTTLRGLPLEPTPLGYEQTPWVMAFCWVIISAALGFLGLAIASDVSSIAVELACLPVVVSGYRTSRAAVGTGLGQRYSDDVSADRVGSRHGIGPRGGGSSRVSWMCRRERTSWRDRCYSCTLQPSASHAQRSGRVCRFS